MTWLVAGDSLLSAEIWRLAGYVGRGSDPANLGTVRLLCAHSVAAADIYVYEVHVVSSYVQAEGG